MDTSRGIARQAPLSLGFPKQEYWSGLPFPSSRDLSDPGIQPVSPALAGRFLITEPPWLLGKRDAFFPPPASVAPPQSPLQPLPLHPAMNHDFMKAALTPHSPLGSA